MDFSLESVESLDFSVGSGTDINFSVTTPSAVGVTPYDGNYEVVPKTYSQTLETKLKLMTDDMTIKEIPYFETSNEDGTTVYIANTVA